MPPIFGIGSASKILISSKWIAVEFIMTFKLIKTENHVAYKNVTCIPSTRKLGGNGSVQLLY